MGLQGSTGAVTHCDIVSRPNEILPAHIAQSVSDIADLHEEHRRSASFLQRIAEAFVQAAGRPLFAGGLLIVIGAWMVGNTLAGNRAYDVAPFPIMQDAIGVLALLLTVLILISQRREYKLEERRARLGLQLALLAERKNAKIIEMLERLTAANPYTSEHVDHDATAMSKPADAAAILSAVDRH